MKMASPAEPERRPNGHADLIFQFPHEESVNEP
jgi:hypothetical protein